MYPTSGIDVPHFLKQSQGCAVVALDEGGDDGYRLLEEDVLGRGHKPCSVAAAAAVGVDNEPVDPTFAAIVGGNDGTDEATISLEAEDGLDTGCKLAGQGTAAVATAGFEGMKAGTLPEGEELVVVVDGQGANLCLAQGFLHWLKHARLRGRDETLKASRPPVRSRHRLHPEMGRT